MRTASDIQPNTVNLNRIKVFQNTFSGIINMNGLFVINIVLIID